ncbi:MAG: aminotransferase class and family protein [Paenibacillaceae bacterium]|jgi:GntR family transcriptional regulator of abcA and norABC|nr:aminotransferase class and family protein [Paenibacillaceae bacterium]
MDHSGWTPNRSSPVPIHVQIGEFIKSRILNGEWTVGTRLPSQRTLAKSFGVNRSTVVAALDELASLGLVAGNTGGGTKVVSTSWSLLAQTAPTDWASYVSKGIHHPNFPAVQEINAAEFIGGVVRLGTGELAPELLPQRHIAALFSRSAQRPVPLGYEEPKGSLHLRKQIAHRLLHQGIMVSADSILITSGGLQALQLIAVGLLKEGSTVLAEKLSYLHSLHVFQSAGMRLEGMPMDQHGLQVPFLAAYKRQYKPAILYTIPTFHNPTGIVMSGQRRDELLNLCEEHRLPLIEDDAYRDLWLDEPPPASLKARDKNGNVLYVGSMSKTTSPGLRIGWIVGSQAVIERLADIKMQTDYGASSLSQWAAGEWLSSGMYDTHLEELRAALRVRRECAITALERHFTGLADWTAPAGGFYIWLKLRQTISMRQLFQKALELGMLINPGYLYGEQENSCLRLSYSYAEPHQLSEAIGRLAELIRHM